jgi:hypothetical protein
MVLAYLSALHILLIIVAIILIWWRVTPASSATCSSSVIQSLNVVLPLLLVGSKNPAVIGEKTINFTLNIGGLGPDAGRA